MLKAFVKIAISAALLWTLFSHIGVHDVLDRLRGAHVGLLLFALAVLFGLSVVQAFRWSVVVRAVGARLALRQAWPNVLIGLFFNQTLPSTVGGDAVRVWRAVKVGLSLGHAASSILLDRFSAVLATLLVLTASLVRIHALLGGGPAFWALPLFVVAGALGLVALVTFDRLPPVFAEWRLIRAISRLSADSRRVLLARDYGPWVVLLSLFIQIAVSTVVWTIAMSLDIAVDWIDCVVLVPPVMLVTLVPISIAGWGVREGAMVTAFGLVGVNAADALALSIVFGLTVSLVGVPGGFVWALTGPRRAASPAAPVATTEAVPPPGARVRAAEPK